MSAAEMREAAVRAAKRRAATHDGGSPAATLAELIALDIAALPLPDEEGMLEMLRKALEGMTERYCDLVNCGDCGFWNPEEEDEVKASRAAIRAINGGEP